MAIQIPLNEIEEPRRRRWLVWLILLLIIVLIAVGWRVLFAETNKVLKIPRMSLWQVSRTYESPFSNRTILVVISDKGAMGGWGCAFVFVPNSDLQYKEVWRHCEAVSEFDKVDVVWLSDDEITITVIDPLLNGPFTEIVKLGEVSP